jgi:hypothetical protein
VVFVSIQIFNISSFRYKCHKECVQHAPPNCGFSEGKLRRVINNTDIQNALGNIIITYNTNRCLSLLANPSPSSRQNRFTSKEITYSCIQKKKLFFNFILASDSTSPTSSTPMSAPGSPAPHPLIPGYHFNSPILNSHPSICVSESIYCSKFALPSFFH